MFIELSTGAMLNLLWLSDCFQGKHDKNIVIFYMVNGSKVIEEYTSESAARTRVQQVQEIMSKAGMGGGLSTQIVEELPEEGEENVVYLVPTEDEQDMFAEWVYIDGEWNPWGVKRIDLDILKEQIESEVLTKNNSTAYTPSTDYNPATKKYVDDNAVTFKPYPSGFNTSGTTQQFLNSIRSLNLNAGMAYLGQVRLSDMPSGVNVQAEVEVYIYPQNVAYCVMRSAEISPYAWEVNSYENRGWEPVGKAYTDSSIATSISNSTQVFYWDMESGIDTAASHTLWNKITAVNKDFDVLVRGRLIDNRRFSRNTIIMIKKGELYTTAQSNGSYEVESIPLPDVDRTTSKSYTNIYKNILQVYIQFVSKQVSSITETIDSQSLGIVLEINKNYQTPYTPTYPGSPATKKYVDDSITTAITQVLSASY